MTDTQVPSPEQSRTPSPRLKGKPKLFDCPACGGTIKLNAVGHSVRAICVHCGSLVDTSNEHLLLIQRMNENLRPSLLQLGSYGTLAGKRWQVIGWMEKEDRVSTVTWNEYLLFNPYYGFRFLIHGDGHWSLLEVVKQRVSAPAGQIHVQYDDRTYDLFQSGKTQVNYVAGEFYWEVTRGEISDVRDYIAPPYLLSVERSDGEINVAHGEYIDADIVATTFGLGSRLPDPMGVAPNQPSPYEASWRAIRVPAILFIFCAVVIQIFALSVADNETLLNQWVNYRSSDPEKTVVLPKLKFSDQLADVVVETSGSLDNQWMEVDFELVNETTNEGFQFRNAMEYYSGYSGGENWAEGDRSTDTVITMVPGGEYTLIAEMDSGPPSPSGNWSYNLRVRRDVALWANFWTVLLLGGLIPLYVRSRHHSFEKRRWSQSDFAPVMYRSSE